MKKIEANPNSVDQTALVNPETIYPPDVLEWMALSPQERAARAGELWDIYLTYGGSLEPDIDPQSPFFDSEAPSSGASDGRAGVHLVRRC
jgi:hypothetical protein